MDQCTLRMEQIQEDQNSQHKFHFIDFIGVDEFDLFYDYLVDLINWLQDGEKRSC